MNFFKKYLCKTQNTCKKNCKLLKKESALLLITTDNAIRNSLLLLVSTYLNFPCRCQEVIDVGPKYTVKGGSAMPDIVLAIESVSGLLYCSIPICVFYKIKFKNLRFKMGISFKF